MRASSRPSDATTAAWGRPRAVITTKLRTAIIAARMTCPPTAGGGEAEVRQDRRGDEQTDRRRAEEDRGTDQEADHRPAPPRATSIVMGS